MANEERLQRLLRIRLNERALYVSPSPEAQVYLSDPKETIFIYPPSEQDLKSGSVALGLMTEWGSILPGKFYFPIIATREEELKSALEEWETLIIKGQGTISDRNRLELLGRIELCISEAQVITPESL